jgi:hypothetical protein
MRWCTVTVTDQDGRRHNVDVQATSTFDAAHLFVVEAKKERAVGLPKPTLATMFEVVAAGKVYRVTGTALQTWIVGEASDLERAEGISVLQEAGTGIIGNGTARRYQPRAALRSDELQRTWKGVGRAIPAICQEVPSGR